MRSNGVVIILYISSHHNIKGYFVAFDYQAMLIFNPYFRVQVEQKRTFVTQIFELY